MAVAALENIAFGFLFVLGVLPLARILKMRVVGERSRGAHARPGPLGGPAAEIDLGHAIRMASMSVVSAVLVITHPHGLVYWTGIGVIVVVLLWEPVSWLTAYLVRRANGQDA